MKEHGLVFCPEMVQAFLDGHKTMTRRRIQPGRCPYQVGEVRYIREALEAYNNKHCGGLIFARYRADGCPVMVRGTNLEWRWQRPVQPSIFMPREAARAWVRITAVRAEQVHDITEADARAEGFRDTTEFVVTWNILHGPNAWERNEWVWVVTFEQVQP